MNRKIGRQIPKWVDVNILLTRIRLRSTLNLLDHKAIREGSKFATNRRSAQPISGHLQRQKNSDEQVVISTNQSPEVMQNPIDKFNRWWKLAILETPLKKKNAICVSTIGKDGFPNARFVDLKAVDSEGFKFCSHFDSVKGKELHQNPKVALTIWWDHVGLQVRVIGIAKKITNDEAIKYWEGRSRAAQLTTLSSQQSQPMESESRLRQNLANIKEFMGVSKIEKPSNWGGYVVIPRSIEFLTFREDRLHLREHYEYSNAQWNKSLLQP